MDEDGSAGVSRLGGWAWGRYVVEPDARGIGTVRWPRTVPKDADCAASLGKRTLTNLYNQRPAWLALAHKKLDEAVFAAYGWDPGMSDEDLLAKLLALNLERDGGQDLKQIVAYRTTEKTAAGRGELAAQV